MSVLPPPGTGPIPWLYNQLWQAQGPAGILQVYRGAYCPCANAPSGMQPDPGQGDPTCPLCGGIGLMYPEPSLGIQCLLADSMSDKYLVEAGLAEPGRLSAATPPGGPHLNLWDLCLLPWSTGIPDQGQLVQRGPGNADQLWYRAEAMGGVWSEGPAGLLQAYRLGIDFTFAGRVITWIGQNRPAFGQTYSVRYSARFEWIVASAPQQVFAWDQDLGQRAILRKRHEVIASAPSVIEG